MQIRVLFVVPYPTGKAPSQRFRFEQYFNILTENGIIYDVSSFVSISTWEVLYKPGHLLQKSFGILLGFLKRFLLLFTLKNYNFIFIHREATPIGPPWFEWIVTKGLKMKIIYDFDDAIWIPNTSDNNKIIAGLKWHDKVGLICSWSYKVSCGNQYLKDFATQYNSNVIINPTTIDTLGHHNEIKSQEEKPVVIGWTGTHSTMKYLDPLVPIIKQLEAKHNFGFLIISNSIPKFSFKSLRYIPWTKEKEITDLLKINIGVMPLEDDQWAKGKCAFKALQYMALGIPALVSPVGMNLEVVDQGKNGFICGSASEWSNALEKLLLDTSKRIQMGNAARQKVESTYSVSANHRNFLKLLI